MKKSEDYYIGLDIGTNSVGYAVTDFDYNVKTFRERSMWGVQVFNEGEAAEERRLARSARRSLARRKQRTELLRGLLEREILKVDKDFFKRQDESMLYLEDKKIKSKNVLFNDENFTDIDYFNKFKTINHLIMHLIESNEKEDIRYLYLAANHLLKNRGNFLMQISKDSINEVLDFDNVYFKVKNTLTDLEYNNIFELLDLKAFSKILESDYNKTTKQKEIKELLPSDYKPTKQDTALIKALTAGVFNLFDLFEKEEYKEIDITKLQFDDSSIEDQIPLLKSLLEDYEYELIENLKLLYDWSILKNLLSAGSGQSENYYVSSAKVALYEKHREDLKYLKYLFKTYLKESYNYMFRDVDVPNNYVSYVYNHKKQKGANNKLKSCTYEDFTKELRSLLKDVIVSENDKEKFDEFIERLQPSCGYNEVLPKLRNRNNSTIPYQLNRNELKIILENQSKYYPFLKEKDSDELSIIDKILSIMEFKIPYFVGPLKNTGENNAWIVKKKDEIIYPWNIDEIVDYDKSEEAFIREMTNKCTFLPGEDTLPKYSLLYSKYSVLNEINNIKLKNMPIDVEVKQEIYKQLFLDKKSKVTKKKLFDWFNANGISVLTADEITGIDINVNSSLKSYHDFKEFILNKKLTEDEIEEIILRITLTTDRIRFRNYLLNTYKKLDNKDVNYISNLTYSGFGRLSKKLLNGISAVYKFDGEGKEHTIISLMKETNYNLSEILSKRFGYISIIEKFKDDYYSNNPNDIEQVLDDMYVSPAVKRPIYRTLAIVEELKKVNKKDPKKIFIEMARDNNSNNKKKRTESRKNNLIKLYKTLDKEYRDEFLSNIEKTPERNFQSQKLFLYYTQLGKCMYSGKPINLADLMSDTRNHKYDIDHIYPQSKVKDDSILNNKVLVFKNLNHLKSNEYPISSNVSDKSKMKHLWGYLLKSGLITPQKYGRLIRNHPLTDKELSDFINRQLVETRQSTKAIAYYLKELYPKSEIVYVKASLTSDFRKEFDLVKSREINDNHHAKDAYLNIVMGNIYHTKFTSSPANFIKDNKHKSSYSVNIKSDGGLLSRDIVRNDIYAWRKEETIKTVKNQMKKNDINYVKYQFEKKGAIFDLQPVKAGTNDNLVPLKKGMDPNKYGGYNKPGISFYTLVKSIKKEKEVVSIEPIRLMDAKAFKESDAKALNYLKNVLNLKSPEFLSFGKILKVNTVLNLDGFRVAIAGRAGNGYYYTSSLMPLIVDAECEKYFKNIESYNKKKENYKDGLKIVPEFDKITIDENKNLYDVIVQKLLNPPYNKIGQFKSVGLLMEENENTFFELSIENQVYVLTELVKVFRLGRTSVGCDLRMINGKKTQAVLTLTENISTADYKKIEIINQSNTGLFEQKSRNLKTICGVQ